MPVSVLFGPPDSGGGLVAIDAWHVHIHEDGIEGLLLEQVDGFLTAGHQRDKMPPLFEHARSDELIHMAVFDNEHPHRGMCGDDGFDAW